MKAILTILLTSAAVMMLAQSSVEAQARASQASVHSQNKCENRCRKTWNRDSKQAHKEYMDCMKKSRSDPKQKDKCGARYMDQQIQIDTDAEHCAYECKYRNR